MIDVWVNNLLFQETTFLLQMVLAGICGAIGCLVIVFCNIRYRYVLYGVGVFFFIISLLLTLTSIIEVPHVCYLKKIFEVIKLTTVKLLKELFNMDNSSYQVFGIQVFGINFWIKIWKNIVFLNQNYIYPCNIDLAKKLRKSIIILWANSDR